MKQLRLSFFFSVVRRFSISFSLTFFMVLLASQWPLYALKKRFPLKVEESENFEQRVAKVGNSKVFFDFQTTNS